MPILSILIPVFNTRRYLAESLDSACGQTLRDIEIICLDDGSTDGSAEILDECAERDGRLKVVHKPNTGFGDTMNVGLAQAQGKYVAFLESDDFIGRDAYAELVAAAEKSGAEIVKGNYFEFRVTERNGKRARSASSVVVFGVMGGFIRHERITGSFTCR